MTVLGTVAYMAPELVNAQKHYTEAIDVYAMGVTFWEIWTGKDPFARENTFSLYQLIAQGERPAIPATCPQGFKDIIEDSWNSDADLRPSSMCIAQKMAMIVDQFAAALPDSGNHASAFQLSPADPTNLDSSVKINFTRVPVKECDNTDISFQYDDTYAASSSVAADATYTNPLKRFLRMSFKNT